MRLASGAWRLTVAPALGGAIQSLTRAGTDILRPTPPAAIDPLAMACFPLVPYANRIGFGCFEWQGRRHRLAPNKSDQAHPLHGIGWLTPWRVAERDDGTIVLRMEHEGDDAWPWRFAAEQSLTLSPDGLTVALDIGNTGDAAMPVSLGLHPYFAAAETLRFEATGMWLVDEELLPTRRAAADALGDWSVGGALSRPDLIDHCYVGWDGTATIARADGDIVLEADGTDGLHLYLPQGQNFFCAEPVTAMPDAINYGEAAALEPGKHMQITMRIRSA